MNESEAAGDVEPAGSEERPPAAAEDAEAMEAASASASAAAAAAAAARGRSGPEAAAAAASASQELPYELQQGYRILGEFLQEKHRGLTAPFLQPFGSGVAAAADPGDREPEPEEPAEPEAAAPRGAARALLPRRARPDVGLLQMEAKFARGQYASITDFVADFRAMLEACYRRHGVDHWVSKQGQKLEMMLEQKLALLSR